MATMKKGWIILLSGILLSGLTPSAGYGRTVSFTKHSVDEGLSQSTVTAIAQDRLGNIWMGTQDGLNRYDGYGFEVFHADPSSDTALNNNSISALLLGADGRLWIGTSTGLSCYDFRERRFRNFTPANTHLRVADILDTDDGLMLATDSGVLFFDPEHPTGGNRFLTGINVRALCPSADGQEVLVATSSGLFRYRTDRKQMTLRPEMEGYDLSSIVPATSGGYWIATHGNGLFRIDEKGGTTACYTRKIAPELASDYIRVLKCDRNRRLWIGTYDGLSILDEKSGSLQRYVHTSDPSSISHNSVWSICIDDQQGVWLGTYYGGVNYCHPLADKFSILKLHDDTRPFRPVYGTVSCIVNDPDPSANALWIGTNDDGIFRYDISTGTFTCYDESSVSADRGIRMSNNIKCILPDGRGGLYVGAHIGGLSHLDLRTRRMSNYPINANSPINNGCYALLDEGDGTLWVGTLSGLFSFDKQTHLFSRHPAAERESQLASHQITTLCRDSKQRVWVGTDAGLYICSEGNRDVRSLSGTKISGGGFLDEAFVLCIMEDTRHNIWVGTKQGLLRYDEYEGCFAHFTHRNGLPNDCIYGILEDDLNRLWLSTNNGLSCFDPQQFTFRNYRRTEGIANNQFNNYAYCRDRSGTFYFGGLDGITRFRPFELQDNPYAPAPCITDLVPFNGQADGEEPIELEREENGMLTRVAFSSRIKLFTIRFTSVNQLAGRRNRYRYTLKGFDSRWYETTDRETTYSNLAPGNYLFRLQAANNDGRWSDRETQLQLRILPRWWQTSAARAGFFALLLGLVGVVVWFLTSRMRMQLELKMERKEKERIEELSQEKIRFYINLSHELRTPLTLILSPLQEIREHGAVDKYVQTRLQYIHRSSTRLLHIINQMLDYRKAELGMFRLQVAMQDVEAIVRSVFSLFGEIAQNRDMDYILNSELKGELLPVDRQFLEMSLMNLLTNAFKFTPSGGIIRLTLRREGGRLLISVRDSGIGISAANQQAVFERFYQVDESRSGNGIGLSIVRRLVELHHGEITLCSEEGSFSEFTLSLPDTLEAYTPEEQAADRKPQNNFISENLLNYLADACTSDQEKTTVEMPGPDGEERDTLLLVVDDNSIRNYLSDHFRTRYPVYAASDGQQALDLLKSIEPSVIIADRVLHGMDGLKFCQAVKQNIRTCHIPVILLSSKESEEDQITGIEAGADDYISQPFSITLLQAKVVNLLKSCYRLRHHYSNSAEIDPDKLTSNAMDGDFLKRAIRAVEENMDNENFSSNDFAQALCMSRSNLHLKITAITGESATKFIRKIRFNYACKLLLERKYTISEISSMVGFNSPSYFTTSFKKHVGCLPTEYVRSRRTEAGKEKEERISPEKP